MKKKENDLITKLNQLGIKIDIDNPYIDEKEDSCDFFDITDFEDKNNEQ